MRNKPKPMTRWNYTRRTSGRPYYTSKSVKAASAGVSEPGDPALAQRLRCLEEMLPEEAAVGSAIWFYLRLPATRRWREERRIDGIRGESGKISIPHGGD
jgi:hypothetical protein